MIVNIVLFVIGGVGALVVVWMLVAGVREYLS